MMSYVYAITDRPNEPLPRELGLDDEELAQVVFRDIGAVVSTHAASHVSASADKLWRHEQVVESLMGARAVLPVRFGTLLASLQEVEEMLRGAYPVFIEDIARVRDHVEIGIRFLTLLEPESARTLPQGSLAVEALRSLPGSGPRLPSSDGFAQSAAAPGTAYLRARLVREQERRDRRRKDLGIIRDAYRILAEHATASKLDDDAVDAPAVSATFLVHRDCLMSFRHLVGGLADIHPELALLCTGPWPAYSFVSAHVSESTARAVHDHVQ
jgi:hypothetical protein